MRWVRRNKGNVALSVLVVLLGVFVGLFMHSIYHPAEAMIGGVGNLNNNDNPHNLSASSNRMKAESEEQICIFCHTPHGATKDTSLINGPLWNHKLSTLSYIVKTNGTNLYNGYLMGGAGSNIVLLTQPPINPDGASRMCLSCHDGTVGVGAVYSRISNIAMATDTCLTGDGRLIYNPPTCNAVITGSSGNDLTQKHVISIPMNDTLITNSQVACGSDNVSTFLKYPWDSDTSCGGVTSNYVKLRPTATYYGPYPGVSGGEGTPAAPAPFYKTDYDYGIQCSTCHDPHLFGVGAAADQPGYKFLVTDKNSLCKHCHNVPPGGQCSAPCL